MAEYKLEILTTKGKFLERDVESFKFNNGRLVVMEDTVEWSEQIDLQRAEDALARAKDRTKSRDAEIDMKKAEMALQRAITRIKCGELNEH